MLDIGQLHGGWVSLYVMHEMYVGRVLPCDWLLNIEPFCGPIDIVKDWKIKLVFTQLKKSELGN